MSQEPIKPELPIVTRERIQQAVPLQDCSGRTYPDWEREDIVRYMLFAAEIQRDRDIDYLVREV